MENKTTIILTSDEAQAFKQFMREREKIAVLAESGFFELNNCRIFVDFDHKGYIMNIGLLSRSLWKRGKGLDKHNLSDVG